MRFAVNLTALMIAIGLGGCDGQVSPTVDPCLLFVKYVEPSSPIGGTRRAEVVRRTTPECAGKP